MPPPTRSTPVVGLSERWSLARHLIGSPIIVIFHASLPHNAVTLHDLNAAVSALLIAYPILSHAISGQATNSPHYHSPCPIKATDMVETLPLSHGTTTSDLIREANQRGFLFNLETGPLIRFQLHQSDEPGPGGRDSLICYFDHIICDGLGGRNLFSDLLSLLSLPGSLPVSLDLPARMDDTVDLFPTPIPVPTLSPTFPTTEPEYTPRTAPQVLHDMSIPQDVLAKLLLIGKQHDVPTLQSILHTASLLALYHASTSGKPLTIRTSTPISERSEASGHPRSTGNYVIFHYANTLVDLQKSFWDEARRYSADLRHPSARINAKAALGTFGRLPEVSGSGDGRTGWDEHMDELVVKANGKERLAIAVSNVGRMELPSEGRLVGNIEDVYFAQSASAVGAAIVMSIISYQDGPLTISFCSKEGSLPSGVFGRFIDRLPSILTRVALGEVKEETILGSI